MKKQEDNFDPRIVVFACNWCSYAGADTAGVGRMQYPPDVRLIGVIYSSSGEHKQSSPVILISYVKWDAAHKLAVNQEDNRV